MMKRIVPILMLLIIPVMGSFLSCRSSSGAASAMKRIEDTKAEKSKEVQKQYDEALKRHYKIQSKSTQKQMKEMNKKSKEFNNKTRGR